MDPPSYGRGPKGEIWKIEEAIHPLVKLCAQLLSDEPLFFLINSYTTGLQPAVLTYMLSTELKSFGGHCDSCSSMWSFWPLDEIINTQHHRVTAILRRHSQF